MAEIQKSVLAIAFRYRSSLRLVIPVLLVFILCPMPDHAWSSSRDVPVKKTVTMLDLGSSKCIPCMMMEPILKEVGEEYEGRAAVIFIDVWEDRSQGEKFGIRTIPTQIFFDRQGREVWRHEGFIDKKGIMDKLDTLLSQ